MKWLVMVILVVLASSFQAVIPAIRIAGEAKLPILLGVVIYYALAGNTVHMVVSCFVAGFLQDALSYIPLGYSSLLFLLIGFIASRFKRFIRKESLLPPLILGGLSSVLITVVTYILLRRRNLIVAMPIGVFFKSIGTGIIGALITPLVYWIGRLFDSAVDNTEVETSAG